MKCFAFWFSPRTWRLTPAVATVFLMPAMACSDVGGDERGNTIIEVLASESNNGAGYAESLLYSIECVGLNDELFDNRNPADDVRIEGPFAIEGDETYTGVDVWRASVALPPGPCAIRVRAFGSDDQEICGMSESFSVSPDPTTEIRLVLLCSGGIQVGECTSSQDECNTRAPDACGVQSDCVVAYGTPLDRGCLDSTIRAAPVGCVTGCDVDAGLEVILDPDGSPWLVRTGVLPEGWAPPSEPFNLVVCDDE